ncbi:hypothetical protein JCM21714_3754 [Gracilibacillus boraciitolerans JCM 21714]|uniref:Uncharacterized protein n=1 Tax=Gracilibacillus boraciitolerans JCM 21714 TaxID=1298598 RepID=W4VP12_9BACI|nr:hypothetical protein [Gracilibacillus boraciitolerans]GAE94583.1 hypothetical protein JCM21714_3754 [Gracilibacillus boraciitolerans JCM 21714]
MDDEMRNTERQFLEEEWQRIEDRKLLLGGEMEQKLLQMRELSTESADLKTSYNKRKILNEEFQQLQQELNQLNDFLFVRLH